MKNSLKRVLSIVLVMMLILSCVPTMALAAEDAHAHAAQNITTGAEYDSLATALENATAGQTVKALADCDEAVIYTDGVILDLNGHHLTNVTVPAGVTLTAIDSATDDYEGEYGSLTTDGTVAATVTTAEPKSYVSVNDNGSWSFHRYYAAITAISLKPASAALGYKAEFYGDEVVKNAVVNYGYEMSLNDYAPKTLTKTDKLEKNVLTLRLNNILKEGNDTLNAIGSTANINGKAFITLNLNGEEITLSSAQQTTTLRATIEAINANVAAYSETALQAVRNLCTTYASWMAGWATENIFGISAGEGDLDVEVIVPVTAENNVVTEAAVLSYQNIVATVPAGTVLADGTTELKLTITDKASSDSDIAENEGETLRPLDVHIEGISADNAAPIVICLGSVLPKGLNIGNYELYHVEDGQTVAMTHVLTLDELDSHNEFHYDPATGAVTVAMASFSEITLTSKAAAWAGNVNHTWYNTTDTTLYIYNADQLWSFSQIVGDMAEGIAQDSFAGKTVILHTDIDLNDAEAANVESKIFYPIGYWNSEGTYEKSGTAISSGFYAFQGTFDGNGHIIANFYQNTWEMKGDHNWYAAEDQHYRDGMGLFGKVYGGTVKNLTVKKFSSDGEITTTGTIAAYADNGATFENISIFDCNPRVYNIGNGGIVGCVGWYNNATTDENPVTFRNITVDNTNKISALWGSWDVACGGLVGQYYPTSGQTNATENAGIYMENCHVAAQIDVNNDVCANYQYYAYRYSGMLIGSVRENVTGDDGRVYPDMTGITASGCTVHFGDWNDYYYCELVANSIASYTHDYQFSRLTQVDAITDEMKAGTGNYVIVNGEHGTDNATCYHFVNGVEHKHESEGTETVNGETVLIENNQHIYLEFNNLVTGYGWGVTSKGLGQMDGVTIIDNYGPDSKDKFSYVGEETYTPGTMLTIGQLFEAKTGDDLIFDTDNVQVFVSPADSTSTAAGEYTINTADWTTGTLLLTGEGAATITITDYLYCNPLTVTVTLAESEDDTETTTSYGLIKTLDDLLLGGDLVVVARNRNSGLYYAMTTGAGGYEISATEVTVDTEAGTVTFADDITPPVWTVEFVEGSTNGLSFYNGSQYLTHDAKNNFGVSNDPFTWYAETATTTWADQYSFNIVSPVLYEGVECWLTYAAGTPGRFSAYKSNNDSSTQKAYTCFLQFYRIGTVCEHANKVTVPAKAATCTEAGYTEGVYCNDCQRYLNGHEIINAQGHQWQGKYTYQEANCTQQGIQKQECYYCDAEKLYYTPAGDHSYTYEVTTEATCTTEGVRTGTCSGCGGTVTETIPTVDHSWNDGEITTDPTCTEAGVMTYTCTYGCETTKTEAIDALGHSWNDGEVTTEPTCTAEGVKTYTCTVCGETKTESVAMLDHTYVDGTCSGCGAVEDTLAGTYYIATIRSSGNYWYMTNDLGTASTKRYQAEDSGLTTLPTQISAPESNKVFVIEKNDDGTYSIYAQGITTDAKYLGYTSGNSGTLVAQSSALKLTIEENGEAYNIHFTASDSERYLALNSTSGNDYFVWYKSGQTQDLYLIPVKICEHTNTTTTTVDATCSAAGSTTVTCDDCGATISTEEIAKLDHTVVTDAAIAATCTATGLTEGSHCSVCNEVIVAQTVTDKIDHTYVDGTCSVCGAEEPVVEEYTVTFSVPEGVDAVDSITDTSITLPTAGAPDGYTFLGWVTAEVDNVTDEPTYYAAGSTLTENANLIALYSYTKGGTGSSEYVLTDLANIGATDEVVITMTNSDGIYAMSNGNGTSSAPTATEVTVVDKVITSTVDNAILWNISNQDSILTIYPNGTANTYLYATNTNNGVRVGSTKGTWKVASNGYLQYNTTAFTRYLGVYNSTDWRTYTNVTGNIANQTLSFYVKSAGSETIYTTSPEVPCAHSNTTEVTVDATCTAAGSVTVTCDDCGTVISTETIAATGHSYNAVVTDPTETEQGYTTYTCTVCGDSYVSDYTDPTGSETTVKTETMTICGSTGTLASDSSSISWTSRNITFTNKKGSTAIRTSDSDHYRIYSDSTVTISGGKITKIVLTCTSSSYATVMQTSLTNDGYTATVSGSVVTVELTDAVNQITFTASAQTRINKVEVTYTES